MAELKTFIFTDIVRSVGLKAEMTGRDDTERDRSYIDTVLSPHRERIEAELAAHGGRIVSTAGDGHFLVFSDTIQAADWAINVQRNHQRSPITTPQGTQVEVRMSMHVGVPQIDPRDDNNYVGKPVDYAARLNDFAQGGQVLVSNSVRAILEDAQVTGVTLYSHGPRTLRGIGRVEVHELVYRELGPQDTVYQPMRTDARQWTVISEGPDGQRQTYPAVAAPAVGSQQSVILHPAHPRRLGNYQLGELLGSGGMGDVYRAQHTQFGRERAVKVIKQRLVEAGHDEMVRRFYQEIKAVGKLEHPNIVVAVESSAPSDQVHYLVMEYIEGIGLDELTAEEGRIDVASACEIARQTAKGLQYIHRHGMVHRDIKPSNLMLTLQPRGEAIEEDASNLDAAEAEVAVVKILDLGLALLIDDHQERLTRVGHGAIGTNMYMAPEQWRTSSVDIRADIYSLGCTLYHLLAGHPPFLHSDLKPEKAHEKMRVPPLTGDSRIPRKLWDVLRRMLAKRPADRFREPAEVVAALKPFCRQHTLVALSRQGRAAQDAARQAADRSWPGALERRATTPLGGPHFPLTKPRRPWRGAAAIAAAVLLLVATAAAVAWWPRASLDAQARDLVVGSGGLNSNWWFDEAPWLQPAIRAELYEAIRGGEARVGRVSLESLAAKMRTDDAAGALRMLHSVAFELSSRLTDGQRNVFGQLDIINPDQLNAEDYERELSELIAQLRKNRPTAAVDWHLLAILEHDLARWKEAEASYLSALAAYAASGPECLEALCAADFGIMLADQKRYRETGPRYAEARAKSRSPLLDTLTLLEEARASYRLGNIDGALERMQQAANVPALAEHHPLRAFLLERKGWILADAWRLEEAKQSFDASKAIIQRQQTKYRNRHVADLQLWVRQGEATTETFLGHWQDSIAIYQDLLKNVEDQLQTGRTSLGGSPLHKRLRDAFEERLPSIHLRLGDCYLLQEEPDYARAIAEYDACIQECKNLGWEQTDPRAPYVIDWKYKKCLPLVLAGNVQEAQQQYETTAAREQTLLAEGHLTKDQTSVYAFTKQLARHFIDLHDPAAAGEQATAALYELVMAQRAPIGRHYLGGYVLAIEQLARSDLKNQPEQLRQLALQINAIFGPRATGKDLEIRGYLAPFLQTLRDALAAASAADPQLDARAALEVLDRILEDHADLAATEPQP